MINEQDSVPRRYTRVIGRTVAAADLGAGPPVIFLHGSIAHSYAWRNIIPYLAAAGHHCVGPDLRGMGNSEVEFPSGTGSYTFVDQLETVESFIQSLEPPEPAVIVGHELGAMLALQFARRNTNLTAGLVLLEGVFRISNDALFDPDLRDFLVDLRGPAGEDRVLMRNELIETYLPRLTSRTLTAAEMMNYRDPYRKPGESRRAMLSMIRQLPLQSIPGPIDELVEETRLWCAQSRIPKLVIGGSPGFLVPPSILGTASRWANTSVASVRGLHFLMEDSPARITALLLDWLAETGHSR